MFKMSLSIVTLLMSTLALGRELIVVGESFPPFEFKKDDKVVGIDVDIATSIFKKIGITPKFQITAWKRAWHMAEKGKADAILSTSRKEKRKPFLYYPKENMWISSSIFFSTKDDTVQKEITYEDAIAKKYKIGIIRGNSYHPSFWKAFPNRKDGVVHEQLSEGSKIENLLRQLSVKRVDLVVADKIVGMYTAKSLGLKNLTPSANVLYQKGYPMPFTRNSSYPDIQNVALKFEEELRKMKKTGEYQKILDKWLK